MKNKSKVIILTIGIISIFLVNPTTFAKNHKTKIEILEERVTEIANEVTEAQNLEVADTYTMGKSLVNVEEIECADKSQLNTVETTEQTTSVVEVAEVEITTEEITTTTEETTEYVEKPIIETEEIVEVIEEPTTEQEYGEETDTVMGYQLQYSAPYNVCDDPLTDWMGVKYFNGHKETYYSELVLPGEGLDIPGRHVADDGTIRDCDGYIVVAADLNYLPRYSVVLTSLGLGKVYDTGCAYGTIDIYVHW